MLVKKRHAAAAVTVAYKKTVMKGMFGDVYKD